MYKLYFINIMRCTYELKNWMVKSENYNGMLLQIDLTYCNQKNCGKMRFFQTRQTDLTKNIKNNLWFPQCIVTVCLFLFFVFIKRISREDFYSFLSYFISLHLMLTERNSIHTKNKNLLLLFASLLYESSFPKNVCNYLETVLQNFS